MIALTNKRFKSLRYWANVGYGAKGKEYKKAYPERKDPYYKINGDVLDNTVGEKLSDYIICIQKEVQQDINKENITEITQVKHNIANNLIGILLEGFKIKGGA